MSAYALATPFSAQGLPGETSRDLTPQQQTARPKRKRNGPGQPDPRAEVISLSPEKLLATSTYVCEVCSRGFQRDQNLQLHRRAHNLEGNLKKSGNSTNGKRVYVCPEPSCVHHDPSRALGDITGIKKHYIRKHCERKWRCEKCSKMYATESDMKAHFSRCSSGKFRCEKCGQEFSRKRSLLAHQEGCNVAHREYNNLIPPFPAVPTMPNVGANDGSNAILPLPTPVPPHPLMAPPFANFAEGMGSVNGMHRGQPTDMQGVGGLPMRFGETGEQRNMQGLPAPPGLQAPPGPPVVNPWGDALGMGLPADFMLLGGNDSDLLPVDAWAFMGGRWF